MSYVPAIVGFPNKRSPRPNPASMMTRKSPRSGDEGFPNEKPLRHPPKNPPDEKRRRRKLRRQQQGSTSSAFDNRIPSSSSASSSSCSSSSWFDSSSNDGGGGAFLDGDGYYSSSGGKFYYHSNPTTANISNSNNKKQQKKKKNKKQKQQQKQKQNGDKDKHLQRRRNHAAVAVDPNSNNTVNGSYYYYYDKTNGTNNPKNINSNNDSSYYPQQQEQDNYYYAAPPREQNPDDDGQEMYDGRHYAHKIESVLEKDSVDNKRCHQREEILREQQQQQRHHRKSPYSHSSDNDYQRRSSPYQNPMSVQYNHHQNQNQNFQNSNHHHHHHHHKKSEAEIDQERYEEELKRLQQRSPMDRFGHKQQEHRPPSTGTIRSIMDERKKSPHHHHQHQQPQPQEERKSPHHQQIIHHHHRHLTEEEIDAQRYAEELERYRQLEEEEARNGGGGGGFRRSPNNSNIRKSPYHHHQGSGFRNPTTATTISQYPNEMVEHYVANPDGSVEHYYTQRHPEITPRTGGDNSGYYYYSANKHHHHHQDHQNHHQFYESTQHNPYPLKRSPYKKNTTTTTSTFSSFQKQQNRDLVQQHFEPVRVNPHTGETEYVLVVDDNNEQQQQQQPQPQPYYYSNDAQVPPPPPGGWKQQNNQYYQTERGVVGSSSGGGGGGGGGPPPPPPLTFLEGEGNNNLLSLEDVAQRIYYAIEQHRTEHVEAMLDAVKKGDIIISPPINIKELLKYQDFKVRNGATLLHTAILAKDWNISKILVTEGAPCGEPKDGDGNTPIIFAVKSGLGAIVEHMLDKGKTGKYVFATDREGRNLLHHIVCVNPPAAKLIGGGDGGGRKSGASSSDGNVNSRNLNRFRLVKRCVEELGLEPNTTDKYGFTALELARENYLNLGPDGDAIIDYLENPPSGPNFMQGLVGGKGNNPQTFRRVMLNPYFRLLLIILLFGMHCIAYAVNIDERDDLKEASHRYVFHIAHLIGVAWPEQNSTLLIAKFCCILFGFLFGTLIGIGLLWWGLGKTIFQFRVFGGGPNAEIQEPSSMMLAAYGDYPDSPRGGGASGYGGGTNSPRKGLPETTDTKRGIWFVAIHSGICGIFLAGLAYNALLENEIHLNPNIGETVEMYRVESRIPGVSVWDALKVYFSCTLIFDVIIFVTTLDTMMQQACLRIKLPFASFQTFGSWAHDYWPILRYFVVWLIFLLAAIGIPISFNLDLGDFQYKYIKTTDPIQRVAIAGIPIFLLAIICLQDWTYPCLYPLHDAVKLPGLPFSSNNGWFTWFFASLIFVMDARMIWVLADNWFAAKEPFESHMDKFMIFVGFIPTIFGVLVVLFGVLYTMSCCGPKVDPVTELQPGTLGRSAGTPRVGPRGRGAAQSPHRRLAANGDRILLPPRLNLSPGAYQRASGDGRSSTGGGDNNYNDGGGNPNTSSVTIRQDGGAREQAPVPRLRLDGGGGGGTAAGQQRPWSNGGGSRGAAAANNNKPKYVGPRDDIYCAAYNDDIIRVCKMLDEDPSLLNKRGGIGLYVVYAEGIVEVATLKDAKAGATPLHYAVAGNAKGAVSALISRGANPRVRTQHGMFSAKEVAEIANHYQLAELL